MYTESSPPSPRSLVKKKRKTDSRTNGLSLDESAGGGRTPQEVFGGNCVTSLQVCAEEKIPQIHATSPLDE